MKFSTSAIILCFLLYPIISYFSNTPLEVLWTGQSYTMTLQDFIQLDGMEQLEIFWSGDFVGELSDGEFRMVCHQVNDFYIEYKILGGHYLDMRTFRDPDLLEPYLWQIDISDLVY